MESKDKSRLSIRVRGAVQGVGFRPFIYRLAERHHLTGWIVNNSGGVHIEAQGMPADLDAFLRAIREEAPPHAVIRSVRRTRREPSDDGTFRILQSDGRGAPTAWILPDIATCPDCLREIFDPADRRHLYPFTNCTYCGPRFTILERIPYDRPNTSMKAFRMCAACEREYNDPRDRRFHAQPNACPDCGPQLEYRDRDGRILSSRRDAMDRAAEAILGGKIVTVKGLGGFHLIADAADRDAVRALRERKNREEKPLALMVPDLDAAETLCDLSEEERRWLAAPEAPIVLADKKPDAAVAPEIAPDNPFLGIMLPYTPLHHILLAALGRPVVATSGNRSDEPICIDNGEALARLRGVADAFLVHDRPILRPVDDSVGRIVAGERTLLRRSRGYAPLPISVGWKGEPALAVGGQLKNTVALAYGDRIQPGQHIGDLDSEPARDHFIRIVRDLQAFTEVRPGTVLHDLNPDYASTQEASRMEGRRIPVQHHLAHVAACMAEHGLEPPVLGVAWDGAGYGTDGTVWGGEFLTVRDGGWERTAAFRPFPLAGGDRAAREPRRSALGVLWGLFGDKWTEPDCPAVWRAFSDAERTGLLQIMQKPSLAPPASSAGRLFDAVAAMTGTMLFNRFEGQAAMRLEHLAGKAEAIPPAYPFHIRDGKAETSRVDWGPMILEILAGIRDGAEPAYISARFHETLARIIEETAVRIGIRRVVLSGGCFQNKRLTERAAERLTASGFQAYFHRSVPPNDGGISVGQLAALKYGLVRPEP
ncbi:MAG TPA: carbamoyltransferase HypF [bacterium]|nr:carbamoyltransferase HypF [bacterium]